MIRTKGLLFIAALIASLAVLPLAAQTDSPYSRYGYGLLRDQSVGPSRSMGGIGIGLRNKQSANPANPASYSVVDSLTFLFDFGVWGHMSSLSDGIHNESHPNGGLDYITALLPLTKKLGLSFGILPFSSVGYSFGSNSSVDGIDYSKSFTGSGGLSQIYLGIGYELPLKGLSLGVNGSFLFGTLDHTRSISSPSSNFLSATETSELEIKSYKIDVGLQYDCAFSNMNHLVLGAVYTPHVNTGGSYQIQHTETDNTYTNTSSVAAGFPDSYGFGATFSHNNQWTVGFDLNYQDWSKAKFSSVSVMGDDLLADQRFNKRKKIAIGGEYMVKPISRNYVDKIKFRGGINYSNSYINVKNSDNIIGGYHELGATIGFGFPIHDKQAFGNRISYLNVGFDYKKITPGLSNMISEQYIGMSIAVNINELWFFQKKVY